MCEVWKWIIIVTAVPLVLLRLYYLPPYLWWFTPRRNENTLRKFEPYQRHWWLAVFVLCFATAVYFVHCMD